MRPENKFTAQEVHEMLNARAGWEVSAKHFHILVICWRKHRHVTAKGRKEMFSIKDAQDFLHYAY